MAPNENAPPPRAARREKARARRGLRADRYDALFHPGLLASAGALASLAFLFQPSLPLKAGLFALFLASALASGKRVSLWATLLVSLGIVAANLLVPVGRVLWRAGPLVVTESALLDGLDKALTFEGLIYISKASIRPGMRLPGSFGAIVARAFMYYDRIVEYRGRVRPSSLVADIDAMMLSVWDSPGPEDGVAGPVRAKPLVGYILAGTAVAVTASALAVGHLLAR